MGDTLFRSYSRVADSATEFRAPNSSAQSLPADLAAIVGYVPGTLNMMPWGQNWGFTDFTDPQFTFGNASIITGVRDPTGHFTAQHLTESSATGTHRIISDNAPALSTISPIQYQIAVIAQAAERNRIVVEWTSFFDVNATASVGFDLVGGKVGYDIVSGTSNPIVSYSMQNIGNGWWLCKFVIGSVLTPGQTGQSIQPRIYLDNGVGTAARSISYTGDGSSGVNLWWWSTLPLRAWNLNTLSLYDDFDNLNTIDLNNTKTPGFKWYVNNLFPNSFMTNFGWTTNPPSAPTPASNLSISSPSVLKIYNPNNNALGFTSQIFSIVDNGAGGVIGTTFIAPMLFDGLFSYDGTTAGFNSGWAGNPAFWGSSIDALTSTPPPSGRFMEWDVFEAAPIFPSNRSGSTGRHEWSNPPTDLDGRAGGGTSLAVVTVGTFVRFSGLWLPIDGTGWGYQMTFVDGQFAGSTDFIYSASSLPFPNANANCVVGSFSEADGVPFPCFINTAENVTSNPGGGWAFYIDWVKVYTT